MQLIRTNLKERYSEVDNMTEFVILVDGNDKPIGLEEKVKCHLPDGKLHRAFTALLFDTDGKLVLTRRSSSKMLWPGDWDGTFASHPREGETYASSAERRMPEEMGLKCNMDYLFKFEYHVPYKDVGSENEVCGTLIGVVEKDTKFNLIEDEISEIKCLSADELSSELKDKPEIYCPWMIIALYFLDISKPEMLERHKNVLEGWIKPEVKDQMKKSIETHLPESQWRLVKDE